MKRIFMNARIVTPQEVLTGHKMVVEDGKIVDISLYDEKECEEGEYIDVKGRVLMPGLIDIHADMIENMIQPRSTSLMDFEVSLCEAERQLVACGITTMFHSIAMYKDGTWDAKEIRLAHNVEKLARLINDRKNKPHLMNNFYHLRYEIDNLECYDNVIRLIEEDCVQLFSIMDHRPGQGQYKDISVYRRHLPGEGKNLTEEEFRDKLAGEMNKPLLSFKQIKNITDKAKGKNISVASHDDDTIEKVEENVKLNVKICEFPINMETAKYAHEKEMFTLLGAPNVLRGKSHSGNLSALDAIVEGVGDILCSDYYPQALLRAVFALVEKEILPLHEAVKLVTLNPAQATGMGDKIGSIEIGKNADVIVVDDLTESIYMLDAYVDGNLVLKTDYLLE